MYTIFDRVIQEIRSHYGIADGPISLHEPLFAGNERKYVLEAIDSTFVSSVGKFVTEFESRLCSYTGARHAVATVNGTAGLHIALMVAGVERGDFVITQPLSFIATCNAISYLGADPIFVDVDMDTLGLSPSSLKRFLSQHCKAVNGRCIHTTTGRRISACVPMHTFGHPVHLDEIVEVCNDFRIPVVEDAAESMGSKYKGKHTGTTGLLGVFSFNGNKTITCGGGGAIITNDERLAKLAKHLTTQAKVAHAWEFIHDRIGYNYRMPNLNAAMACAQLEVIDKLIESKRTLALKYKRLFGELGLTYIAEPTQSYSNYWLNSVLFRDLKERDDFLAYTNDRKVMTRPVWKLMVDLEMFKDCIQSPLNNSRIVSERLVSLPSGPRIE